MVRVPVVVVSVAVAFIAGAALGTFWLADLGEKPCWQVEQELQAARNTLSETFGGGEEGAQALATLQQAMQEHPDCFSPQDRNFINAAASGSEVPTDIPSG